MPKRAIHCSFCGRSHEGPELMFVSELGGLRAAICSDCIDIKATIVSTHRQSPKLAATLIAAVNARVERERKAGGAQVSP